MITVAAGLVNVDPGDMFTRAIWNLPGNDINRSPAVNNIERVGTNLPGGIPEALVG
jgi:hypothetical protein